MRRGFTLLEMLVASVIFVAGFLTVYSMFLVGIRSRAMADATTRGATLATSLIAEMRLGAVNEISGQPVLLPGDLVGDGDPDTAEPAGSPWALTAPFYPDPDNPGMYYRVAEATDLQGGTGSASDGIAVTILVGQFDSQAATLTYDDLRRRYNEPTATPKVLVQKLLERGSMQRYDAVIHRERRHRR